MERLESRRKIGSGLQRVKETSRPVCFDGRRVVHGRRTSLDCPFPKGEHCMTLRERFASELKEAMRSRDQKRLGTLRLVLAALKERDIANRSETSRDLISDDEILSLLAKMVKQREESAAAYDGGGRPELAGAERAEIEIIRSFM